MDRYYNRNTIIMGSGISVTSIIIENVISDPNSNPGRGLTAFLFTLMPQKKKP